MADTFLDTIQDNISKQYTHEYSQLHLHPEEVGNNDRLNKALTDIKYDLVNIDTMIINKSTDINNLLSSTIKRLDAVKNSIHSEKERLQDIKILCNKFTDFDNVIPITVDKIASGSFNYQNNVYSSKIGNMNKIGIAIESVTGNGIEGNKYVYKNHAYIKDSLDTSKTNALLDNSINTYWEYERITASSTEKYLINDFHMDNEEAKCTLTISSKSKINELYLVTDISNVKIIGLQYSQNNIDYYNVAIPDITLNTVLDSYDTYGYIYGSGYIGVPSCNYVKITLQSNGNTNETIAFERIMFKDDESTSNKVEDNSEENSDEITPITTIVESAKRHLIRISDINAYSKKYQASSYFTTTNLINNMDVYCVAVFANVYIPDGLSKDCVTFVLTINGIEYNVLPLGDREEGIKIIRYSKGNSKDTYTKIIGEVINSVYLTVKIKSNKNLTPYINNVKVILGGDVNGG